MRPTWLIEAGVYGGELTPVLAAVRRQGRAAEVVVHRTLQLGGVRLPDDACVIGYGTFPFAQQILQTRRWTPGAWASADRLDCAAYYPHFGRHLLNGDAAVLPVAVALGRRDELFAQFGRAGEVFVRPTTAGKLFVGRCVDLNAFADAVAPARHVSDAAVVVAQPRVIGREWRLLVVDGRIVAASQYAADGDRAVDAGCPAAVRAFAEAVLSDVSWRPDPVFMLDVCESADDLRVVELNSFSGSWLYACDPADSVAAVSTAATDAWATARAG